MRIISFFFNVKPSKFSQSRAYITAAGTEKFRQSCSLLSLYCDLLKKIRNLKKASVLAEDGLIRINFICKKCFQREPMHCTFGELNPPLGNTRLHVGKLLSAILITNTHNINVQLSELQIFNILLVSFRFKIFV